ncbi:MAG TPA: PilZ domain-containing protein [Candidatus Acidoferrum sp.]|nr:PilZ domain-containing protein [Candidatus Acidoferrum sp.]
MPLTHRKQTMPTTSNLPASRLTGDRSYSRRVSSSASYASSTSSASEPPSPPPSTSVLKGPTRIDAFALLVQNASNRNLVGNLGAHVFASSGGWCPVSLKERRASRRFLMRLPLTVRWTDELVVGEAATESREVSSRGLYFHLPKGLKSGSPVEIVMTLPHELTQAGPVRVRCLGRVLRSSPEHSGDVGVAAAIERYEFMRSGENAA